MAYYSIFPEKDSTIYSHPDRNTLNTGNDEILELVQEKGTSNVNIYYPSRILLQFKNSEIQSISSSIISGLPFSASLQLFSTEHKNLAQLQQTEVFTSSESWNEGTGRFSNLPSSSNGCSWVFRDNSTTGTKWSTSSFASGTTGSIATTVIGAGGGVWYTGSAFSSSQTFNNAEILDLNLDVTNIVQKFSASIIANNSYPDGIPNNGFLIKYADNIETSTSSSKGALSYFSVDTHTVFPPKLTFKWDDSSFANAYTSSGKISGELNVSLYRHK